MAETLAVGPRGACDHRLRPRPRHRRDRPYRRDANRPDGGGDSPAGSTSLTPAENTNLQRLIAQRGAVITEAIPGTEPRARHFPRRNRNDRRSFFGRTGG